MGPSGFIAVLAGWITTEVGRQPYTIYGLLRTADSLAPVDAPAVAASLVAFIVVYFAVFGAGTFYLVRSDDAKVPLYIWDQRVLRQKVEPTPLQKRVLENTHPRNGSLESSSSR